jgi:RsiW-degrading membrane proteinase PrsW (M82 family)
MDVQAIRVRLSAWRTELSYIIGLLIFVGIIEVIVAVLNPQLSGFWLGLVSLLLAIIPAAIWLAVFYSVDRVEPEPKQYVIGVAVLAALIAASIGQPLINGFFNVSEWIGTDTISEILGSILIIGFIQAFLIYATVRFSIFYSSEFDQRIDGVVYGSAAGLGYAAMLNIITVVSSGGIDLGAGVIRIVVTQMVLGALGALLGYFLGRDKFDKERVWWMSVGLVLAAVLYGLYSWLSGEITQAGINLSSSGVTASGYNPWPSLILGTIFAVVVLGIVFMLVNRDLRADMGLPPTTTVTTTTTTTTTPA